MLCTENHILPTMFGILYCYFLYTCKVLTSVFHLIKVLQKIVNEPNIANTIQRLTFFFYIFNLIGLVNTSFQIARGTFLYIYQVYMYYVCDIIPTSNIYYVRLLYKWFLGRAAFLWCMQFTKIIKKFFIYIFLSFICMYVEFEKIKLIISSISKRQTFIIHKRI